MKLTVLDLTTSPANPSDPSAAHGRGKCRPSGATPQAPQAPGGCPPSGRRPRRDRRRSAWRVRVAAPVLAVAAVACWPAPAHAQLSYSFRGATKVDEGKSVDLTVTQSGPGTQTFKYWTETAESTTYTRPATYGTDYLGVGEGKTIAFSGNGDDRVIQLTTYEDSVVEHDETFRLVWQVYVDGGTEKWVGGVQYITIRNDDQATITVSGSTGQEGEGIGFTATLDKALPRGVTLTPSYTNGTAAADDYTANTATLTFAGTKDEQHAFTVSTTEDSVIEANETFTLGFTVPATNPPWNYTGTGGAIAVVAGTGTIEDDDTPAVTIANASATEGDTITFTVTLDKAVSGGLTVTPSFTDDTATKGTDYTENTAALSFAGTAGETQTFTVATTEDTDAELTESFVVSLAVSGTQTPVTATDTAQGIIQDDDGDLAEVTIEDASAEEGDALTFTVTLDRAVSGGLTVTPRLAGGTTSGFATEGTDFTDSTPALSFAGTAGEKKSFTVATIEDTHVEVDEVFFVNLVVSGAQVPVTALDYATGTIVDDDAPALTIADASAVEGDSLTFIVTLDKAVPGGVTTRLTYTDGTATNGTDYTANTAAITFAGTQGETQSFVVATTEDSDEENDETFTVGLAVSGASQTVRATDTATGTITDDDGEEEGGTAPAVTVADASAAEGDSITFTVTLDKAVSGGLTVTPSFTDGTATKGTDYAENTAALTFTGTAGETQSFTVATTEDTDEENDETFTLGLAVSGTSETVTATDTATGTITDDDEPAPALTVADVAVDEGDSITFTVTLDKAVSGGLAVTPSFTDGTATKGTDYTENTAALTFAGTAGETQSFTVATTEDTDEENDETFTVGLAVSGTSETVTATDTATGTIVDDDGDDRDASAPEVTVEDASADEGDVLTFTVTLDKAVAGGLTVTPRLDGGTTPGFATDDTDFTDNPPALSFAGTAGEKKSFTVATIEDTDVEVDEVFFVNLVVSGTEVPVTALDFATGTILDDDGPALTIADASAVEGDSLTFIVTLSKGVPGGVTTRLTYTDGTATKGTDYTANTAAIRFSGTEGETQSFTVATTEDSDEENDETFAVGLTVSGTSRTVRATDTATGTITDDDGEAEGGTAPAVTVADASAAEGDSITFTVTLDEEVSGGLTVTPSFTDGTATKGTDYAENTAAITFTGTAGESKSFTVATTEDTDEESDETFTVGLTVSGTSETVTATDTATGTITDDDGEAEGGATAPAVTVADASAAEGDSITFAVTLDEEVSGGLTVTPSFTDGTATKGTDYTENTAALRFAGTAGESKSFTVATTEDTDEESDETFTVGLTVSGTSETVTATDTATGTITDDDGEAEGGTAPAVTVADASAAEGDSITFTVTLDEEVSGGLTVTPSFTDGTAAKGTDYTENTAGLRFTGTAGETKTFTVATTEDAAVEPDETFTVGLTVSGTSETVTATDTATGTITNDDSSAAVTIEDASAGEGETITFTVKLDKAVSGGLTVAPSFTDGTATKGTDYAENTTGLTFTGTANETQTFTVATTEDAAVEPDETFTVGLTVSGTSETVTATGTITNDDGSAAVTIEDASAGEGETITFTVKLDKAVSGGLTVAPSFTDGTATKGTDYAENTTGLTFTGTANETQTFTVATTEDAAVEPDETFTVSLAVSGTSASVTATDTATGTITNDDGSAAVTIEDASAGEGETITFTVKLDKAVSGGLTVAPSFTDGTATKGTDYAENTTGLTFTGTANETQTFTVATTEDAAVEPDETFTVSLAVSGTSASVTATDTATGTITNDDGSAAVTIEDASAGEGETITFTGTLDKAVSGGLTVTPSFTDGTATKGTDYVENTAGLTFTGTAGETQTFTVATTGDAAVEPDETFTVSLAVSGTSASVTATDTATGTITNDDGSAAVTIEDASASEGETFTFTVTLDKAVGGGLTVTPSFTDGTATEGTDYTENTAELSFAGTAGETQTFTVATTEDAAVEPDETFTVSLAVSGTSASVTATDTATGTITDDDGSATVSVADASASEGETVTFTVTLSKAVGGGLTVTPSFTDGTATEGTDYTENTAGLSFAGRAGETQTFTVATTEDAAVEPDETFTVSLAVSGTSARVTATDTATGTITNDDGSAAVTIEDASASEGETIAFMVTLDKAVSGSLTVTPSFTDGTATNGTDYAENTTGLTFTGTAGETRTFTVATTGDAAVEPDETFTVSLAVSGTSASVTATDTATGTIIDDDGSATVTIADASAGEGETITFTVTLDKAVGGGLTVTPSFTDGTATEGTDYTENTSGLSFAGTAGETQTFTVATTGDAAVEPDETFTVSLAVSGTSASVTATDTATGTITDDDGSAAVTIANASAGEGETITFTVTLDKAVGGGLTVAPSFTDGTATEGTDYTENTSELSFAGTAGETQTFTVATTGDAAVEPDETFTVGLAVSETSARVTATDTATGTIIDDDGSATVTIADASAGEGETLTFTVTLSKAVGGGLTVTPSFTDGTATEGTDYTENTSELSFAGTAGETQTFTVATTGDAAVEPDETFTVGLAVSETSARVTATDTATGTIIDDDGSATVTIADASAGEGETLTFTVTLDKAVSGGVTVTPSFTDGTAAKGTDYTENTASLGFAGTAGETRRFTVATTGDAAVEPDETFTVGLAVSETSASVTATDTATGTIIDDDGDDADGDAGAAGDDGTGDGTGDGSSDDRGDADNGNDNTDNEDDNDGDADNDGTAVTVTGTGAGRIVGDDPIPVVLRAEPARVAETAGPTIVTVTAAFASAATRSEATVVDVTVGASGDTALRGTDYAGSPASFTVTIPAGAAEGSSTFTLEPVDDTLMETDEALAVNGDSGLDRVTGTTVTLEDDDEGRLVVRMEPDVVSETAGPTPVTVVAEIVGATAAAAVPVTVTVGGGDDTAELVLDYAPVDAFTVMIPAGSSRQISTFTLSPVEDDLIEGNETLTVTGEATRLDAASDEGLIRDADLAEARSEGAGRTLFLLARAIGSETVAAIEERFAGGGRGRQARLGRVPTPGPGVAGGWMGPGAGGSVAGMGMSGTGLGLPAVPGAVGSFGSPTGPFAGAGARGLSAPGTGLGAPVRHQPFDEVAWLDGASFVASLGRGQDGGETTAGTAGDDTGWMVWGRAATTQTTVQATPGAQARGDLFTMHAGVDTRVGSRVLLGAAVSHSRGKLGYTLGSYDGPAAVDGDLTSVQPYALWAPRAGLEVWGLGGAGRGTLRVSDSFGTVDTGVGMRLAAGGVRQEVAASAGLAVKADVFHVVLASDAQVDLPAAEATATRARMLVEWQSEWTLSQSARLRPRVELGGRWDGGSDVGGLGTEMGGGISLVHVGLNLELSAAGRYLLAHQAAGFEEWGASVALRAGPGVTRSGPWVSVEPEWGAAASRMQAMWGPQADPGLYPGAAAAGAGGVEPGRLRLAAGYALPEAGTDLMLEAARETRGPQAGASLGVRLSANVSW